MSPSARAARHTQARLLLAAERARPGDTVLAGIHLHTDSGWHTYWQNSGASGAPTTIEWELPKGITAQATQWPVPEKLPDEDLTTYIYKADVVLLVPLKIAADVPPGPLELRAKVDWLECEVLCQKGGANIKATLIVGSESKPSADAPLLASWQKKLPQSSATISPKAWWDKELKNNLRPLVLEWRAGGAVNEADFFPDASEQWEVQPATERLGTDGSTVRLRKLVKKLSGDWPARISGVAVERAGGELKGYQMDIPVQSNGPGSPASSLPAR